jgi:uncharacterized coiled-coil protein SlyX
MNENFNQRDAMNASQEKEILRELIEKTVDNGENMADLEKRMGQLEERVGTSEAVVGGLDGKVTEIGNAVSGFSLDGTRLALQMSGLQGSMDSYVQFFMGPSTKEVHHRHFIGRAVWIVVGLAFVIALLSGLLVVAVGRGDRYERADILWRKARLSLDSAVTKALDSVVLDYNAGPDLFRQDVVTEEERRTELNEKWIQVRMRLGRIHELEKEAPGGKVR